LAVATTAAASAEAVSMAAAVEASTVVVEAVPTAAADTGKSWL
jgi:hypothetical protein